MRTVKVNKEELLEKIRINKKAHIAEYNEAVEGYQKAAEQELYALSQALSENPLGR